MNIPGSTLSDGGSRNMILIVGAPFTGKSTAAATFPNPVFLDFDHKAPVNTTTVPFWNAEFCDRLAPRKNPNHTPNRKDALLNYFRKHVITADVANRIPYSATLILDSVTALDEALNRQIQQEGIPISTKTNKPDGFHLPKLRIDFYNDLFAIIQAWPGNFICIMHEMPEYDKDGDTTGRVKPLLTGQPGDKIGSKFTCMFRQRVIAEPNKPAQYVWDVLPKREFDSNNTLGIKQPTILASYESMMKHATVQTQSTT